MCPGPIVTGTVLHDGQAVVMDIADIADIAMPSVPRMSGWENVRIGVTDVMDDEMQSVPVPIVLGRDNREELDREDLEWTRAELWREKVIKIDQHVKKQRKLEREAADLADQEAHIYVMVALLVSVINLFVCLSIACWGRRFSDNDLVGFGVAKIVVAFMYFVDMLVRWRFGHWQTRLDLGFVLFLLPLSIVVHFVFVRNGDVHGRGMELADTLYGLTLGKLALDFHRLCVHSFYNFRRQKTVPIDQPV